jgi:hypothetical protein
MTIEHDDAYNGFYKIIGIRMSSASFDPDMYRILCKHNELIFISGPSVYSFKWIATPSTTPDC